jgi:hypothetical protein
MKKKTTQARTRESRMLPLVVTIAWILLGSVLAFMCIKVFGDGTAEIGVPALVVAAGLIWYFTERRDRNKPEKHV